MQWRATLPKKGQKGTRGPSIGLVEGPGSLSHCRVLRASEHLRRPQRGADAEIGARRGESVGFVSKLAATPKQTSPGREETGHDTTLNYSSA